ncbi:MAG: hypothetical protein ABS939_05495 [Psychrobacillus sp.]
MKIYEVSFNSNTFKLEANVVNIDYNTLDEQYEKLLYILNSEGLDVLDYNDEIAILVDDRGFEKFGNPIFEVKSEDNLVFVLAGKILFVRNIYNEESTDFGSIKSKDIFYLREYLDIKLKGILKQTL